MNTLDLSTFNDRLSETCEALGGRKPTEGALKVWFQTLKEFPIHHVVDALTAWPRRSTKAPAPKDILTLLEERKADQLAAQAAAERRKFDGQAERTFTRDDEVGRKLRELAADSSFGERRDPKHWARVLWARYVAGRTNPDGTAVSAIQIEFAATALHRTREAADRARSERQGHSQGREAA